MQVDQMLIICCAEDQGHWEQTGMQRRKDHHGDLVDVALEIYSCHRRIHQTLLER